MDSDLGTNDGHQTVGVVQKVSSNVKVAVEQVFSLLCICMLKPQ